MVSQACFDIVVGAVHLDGLWGSGKIDYTLGQKHLGQKGNIVKCLHFTPMKVPESFCLVEYLMTSLVNSEKIPTMLLLPPFVPTASITTCDGKKKFLQEARGRTRPMTYIFC